MNKPNKNIYTIRSGLSFGDTGIGISICLLAVALLCPPNGIFALPFGLYFLLTTYGIKIDIEKGKIMEYTKHLGFISAGEWEENKLYTEIAIIGVSETHQGSIGLVPTNTYTARTIKIILLDKYHVKRIELVEADTVEEANQIAADISSQTGFPVVQFNPVRLTKTRRR